MIEEPNENPDMETIILSDQDIKEKQEFEHKNIMMCISGITSEVKN